MDSRLSALRGCSDQFSGCVRIHRARLAIVTLVALASLAPGLNAQEVFIYPNRGQSAEQQERDKFDCYQWAVQQTGFDPTRAPAPSSMPTAFGPPPQMQMEPEGGLFRGAAGGAALGAVGGAIGGDAGKGAAIGAATGLLFGGFRRLEMRREEEMRQQAYQQQFAAAQAQQFSAANSQRSNYNRAYSACLQGRGYTVN